MSDYKKPLPVVQPYSQAFWDGTKQNKLLIQTCGDCKATIFFPRQQCPDCWSTNLGARLGRSSGRYSHAIQYHRV